MILLTGATGYIGGHLLRALTEAGLKTAVVVRPESASKFPSTAHLLTSASVESMADFIRTHGVRAVVHVAAAFSSGAGEQSTKLIEANILLGSRLLEAMGQTECRAFLHTGTFSQHGSGSDYEPKTLYDATKQAFEAVLDYYVQAQNFQVTTLKLFDVYGPNDPRPKLLELLHRAAVTGEALAVTKGEQLVNMIHVADVCGAYLAALKNQMAGKGLKIGAHHRFFVGGAEGFLPLIDVVQRYERILKKTLPLKVGARPYHPREIMKPYFGQAIPGWKPRISLAAGLEEVIQEQSARTPGAASAREKESGR